MFVYTKFVSALRSRGLLAAVAAACASSAHAAPIEIANASFEQGGAIADGSRAYTVPGWKGSTIVTRGRANPSAAMLTPEATDGTYAAFLAGAGTENQQSAIRQSNDLAQTLSVTLQANMRYTLTVDIGDMLGADNFANYNFGLVAGNMEADGSTSTLLAQLIGTDSVDGGWMTKTLVFETTASTVGLGEQISIFLRQTKPGGSFRDDFTYYDNVRLDAIAIEPVETPEPAALALFGCGLAGLGALRRRRG